MGTTISDMTLACYLPSVTGHKVYCGHFGETPDYAAKIFDLMSIQVPYITEQTKRELLAKMHVKYFVFSQKQIVTEETEPLIAAFRGSLPLPNFLKKVYGNNDADVYEVQ